jgi:prepilin-type N-terminal cleavage/methylation domain-containing protein
MIPRGKSGFTLIELLVVVAIVGLLATVAVISISNASKKARDTKRKADLRSIQKALDLYYQENGAYPNTSGAWWGTCSGYGSHDISGLNGYVPGLAPQYIGKLPVDPRGKAVPAACGGNDTVACYLYASTGPDYKLLAYCTPEGTMPVAGESFYDSARPTQAFMLCNPMGAACAW